LHDEPIVRNLPTNGQGEFAADIEYRKYKGTKIEWDVDECAQPYAPVAPKPRREVSQPKKVPVAANRFQLLNIDDDDDDEDEITSTFQSKKSIGIAA
jgi:hypothetical protein